MKFGNWLKIQKLHTYSLSTLGGRNCAYFRSADSDFWDTGWISKLPYLGRKLGQSSRSCRYTPFLTERVEIELIFALRAAVSEILADFVKLPYLGMKLVNRPKFQKLNIYSLSTLEGWNWDYFPSTGSGFRDTGWFSKLTYLAMKLGHWPKFQKLHIYNPNHSWVPNFTLFCSTIDRFPNNWGFWSSISVPVKFVCRGVILNV